MYVAPGTDTRMLKFEVVRYDLEFEEGQWLEARIGQRRVVYQLLNGLTREEIVQQRNTRGYVIAEARKIGCWSSEHSRFEKVRWIPAPNTPVFRLIEA